MGGRCPAEAAADSQLALTELDPRMQARAPPHTRPAQIHKPGQCWCCWVLTSLEPQARLLPTGPLVHVLHVSARPTGRLYGEDSITIHVYCTGLHSLPHICVSPGISERDVTWKSVLQISSVQMRSSWMKVGPESRSGVLRREEADTRGRHGESPRVPWVGEEGCVYRPGNTKATSAARSREGPEGQSWSLQRNGVLPTPWLRLWPQNSSRDAPMSMRGHGMVPALRPEPMRTLPLWIPGGMKQQ